MKFQNQNFHISPSEDTASALKGIIEGLKDPLISLDASIQLLQMMGDNQELFNASYTITIARMTNALENIKFVTKAIQGYLNENPPKD